MAVKNAESALYNVVIIISADMEVESVWRWLADWVATIEIYLNPSLMRDIAEADESIKRGETVRAYPRV